MKKVNIKEGKKWTAEIKKFKVSEGDAKLFNMRQLWRGWRFIISGTYTKLLINWKLMMSDTQAEMKDHVWCVEQAKWNVFIAGLWLGMVVNAIAEKEEVKSVTVLEINKDVIALVKDSLHKKVRVIKADVFDFDIKEDYDFGWFDIWMYISEDNVSEFKKLKRKYRENIKKIGFWCEIECNIIRKW